VDIDENTYNISSESLEKAVKYVIENTDLIPKVVVAVDLFGQPADFKAIRAVANKYNLLILEDGAQGFGGKIGDKKACSFGDISTTSFFPAKPLGCYGDGGAVFTNNVEWAELIRSYKVHGKGEDKYDNVRIGMNSRLDTIQAVVLLEKLKWFEEELCLCNKIADKYTEKMKGVVKTPFIKEGMTSSWAQYTICLENQEKRERVIVDLKSFGIPTAIYYKKPLHMQKAFEEYNMGDLIFDNAINISKVCVSLPMHPYLTDDEIESITGIVCR
jgi:dTDP-4-amino-4,6-dideoxygalactose transaminase